MTSSAVDSASRNRSNSGEESELPEHDRKRPRLSEGKSDAETQLSESPSSANRKAPSSNSVSSPKPTLPPRSTDTNMPTPSPTSKVTINTRPLSSQSMNQIAPSTLDGNIDLSQSNDQSAEAQRSTGATLTEAISISSSPARSPLIEIAEAEDYDQDPSATKWTRRIGGDLSAANPIRPFHVYSTFPLASRFTPGEAHAAVEAICKELVDGSSENTQYFTAVKDWLVDYTARCTALSAEIIGEDRGFWTKGYLLATHLLKREHKTYPPIPVEDLVAFLNAYSEVTKLVLQYETKMLRDLVDTSPKSPSEVPLMSWYWLNPLAWIIGNTTALLDSLRTYHAIDPMTIQKPCIDHAMDPTKVDLMSSVVELIAAIGAALPRCPKLHKQLTQVFAPLEQMVRLFTIQISPNTTCLTETLPQADIIRGGTEKVLHQLDDILQVAIKKQQVWLTIENAMDIVDSLNKCMRVMAVEVPRIAKDVIASANIAFEEYDLLHLSQTMTHAWKFTTLNRFIKHGRMELRVAGVEHMSTDLVQVFYRYIQNDANGHEEPLVNFLVRFLRANDMTRYIVSVDSHPNLAERAANLVGFLSVAKRYTDDDTDSIWHVVEHGQDPRMIGAAIHLLNGCFVTYSVADFHHVCEKIAGLPYEKVDDRILQFTLSVLQHIRQKTNQTSLMFETNYDPITRRLCSKFLREANTSERCATQHSAVVRREILGMFKYFLQPSRGFSEHLAISEEELTELMAQIREDIDSRNDYACGAVLALHEVLSVPNLSSNTVTRITDQCECPAILVKNTAALSEQVAAVPTGVGDSMCIQFDCRLACLFNLVRLVPDRFDKDLLQTMWISILTAKHLPDAISVQAWAHLTILMRQPKTPNSALRMLLDHFWTRLQPSDFSKATLDFAKQSVVYESAMKGQIGTISTEHVISIPGIERVWTIMLGCPPGTIEMEATEFIISQYLRSTVITRRARSEIHETHLSLIDRSVSQVIGSAERLKSFADTVTQSNGHEGMLIIASEEEIRSEELKFDRSLLFLRCFTNALKKDPGASPVSTRHAEDLPDFGNSKGEAKSVSIRVQANRYVPDTTQKILIGAENTCQELESYISKITGWSQFTTVQSGKKINLQEETSTLDDMKVFQGQPLMVCKTSQTEERQPRGYRAGSPVDAKIMLHFDDLYALLAAENRLAKEVYDFLRTTSVRNKISQPIKAMSTPSTDLLPPQKPYKLLFCIEALKACIEIEYFSKSPDTEFLLYAVSALNQAFRQVASIGFSDPLYMSITYELLETLSMACRTKAPVANSLSYFPHPQDFVEQITQFLMYAQQSRNIGVTQKEPEALVKIALEVLTEACLHDKRIWPAVHNDAAFHAVLRRCSLDDNRESVRRSILDVVLGLNGSAVGKITFKLSNPHAPRVRFDGSTVEACLAQIWKLLLPLLASAAEQANRCQEVCDASLVTLKVVGKSMPSEELQQMFDQWSAALLSHSHYEIVGQALQDRYVAGMAKMLCECARLLRNREALSSQTRLMQELVRSFLFPPLSDSRFSPALSPRPILDSPTRQTLYDLLLVLCQTPEQNDILRSEISNDFVERDYFSPQVSHERQALRSEVGYAGLRNLSKTCYLNSLLSQLFMHVQFRNLLLNTSIIDSQKQRLFVELGKVFAYMQSSHEKGVDPQGAVDSIVTYEGGEIDVTVQMDVDEFFNLLFDRLEGQLVDEKAKAYFKSLYGGETIQQIKSKECEHVSERPESFAALPVEIKGKTRLEESLKAYVDGEVLQGDNKYSCTACGKHVDAVKRNCLKHVPDNLIFNLKRFDFDIMTGTRCKLNDQFQFPEELDIAPYTLEHLAQPDEPSTPDIFELTGVIVHSGTADSGHYFSYIRQRPSARDKTHSWVQFNDSDVTHFDPVHIQDNCFGGIDNSCYGMVKFYNAYMLFYQRKTNIEQTEEHFRHSDPVNPVRLHAPTDLEHHIAQQNELCLRAYCVQDENHARFVRELLGKMWDHNLDKCSDDHAVEDRMLRTTLEYVQQISSRWKGQPEMESTIKIVLNFAERCAHCAKSICDWIVQMDVIPDSMVRSPYGATRKAFCTLLRSSLETLHKQIEADVQAADSYKDLLEGCFNALGNAWDHVLRQPRSWPDFFGLLNEVLLLGDLEAEAMMEYEFLEYCLDIVRLHNLEASEVRSERRGRTRYCPYINAREKNRAINHTVLINFFADLLLRYDLRPDSRTGVRSLSTMERRVLGVEHMPYTFTWLKRIIYGKQAPVAVNHIVGRLAQDNDWAGPVCHVLSTGAEHKSMNVAVAHLDSIVTFCQNGVHENQVIDLATGVLESISTIDFTYGAEYLHFVQHLLNSKNEVLGLEAGFLAEKVLATMPEWAPVLVVAPNESQHDVRSGTIAVIQRLLLEPLENAREEDPPKYWMLLQTATQLIVKGMNYARGTFISRSKESTTMQPGQINELVLVVERIFELLEPGSDITEQRQNEITNTLTMLRLKNEHAVETLSPEHWQESSDLDVSEDFEDMVSP